MAKLGSTTGEKPSERVAVVAAGSGEPVGVWTERKRSIRCVMRGIASPR